MAVSALEYELEALPELGSAHESQETEWEGESESEQFFGALANLAKKYAGASSTTDPRATAYVKGWRKCSNNVLNKDSVTRLDVDGEVLLLARAMFCHEIGGNSPLHDDQIITGVSLKRAGELPPH